MQRRILATWGEIVSFVAKNFGYMGIHVYWIVRICCDLFVYYECKNNMGLNRRLAHHGSMWAAVKIENLDGVI